MDDSTIFSPAYLVACSLVIGGILWWYFQRYRNQKIYKSGLFYKPNAIHEHLTKNSPNLLTQCKPIFLLRNGHVQSIFCSFLSPISLKSRREYIDMEDGGVIALDWVEDNPQFSEETPIIIILPTLTGDLKNSSRFCQQALRKGYRCVVFNKRGHGDSELKSPKLQGFGETTDLRKSVEHIHSEFPKSDLAMVGSSAGSGLMVSYLGVHHTCPYVKVGVAISPGYDMIRLFSREIPKLYELILLFNLKKILKQHKEKLKSIVNMKFAFGSWKFSEYDYHVYCKFGGQDSVLQYWEENNPMRDIDKITVPVLCISSLDDPVCVKENIPYSRLADNDYCMLLVTEKGGHCGFLEGWNCESWSDKTALDYIDNVLKYRAENKTA